MINKGNKPFIATRGYLFYIIQRSSQPTNWIFLFLKALWSKKINITFLKFVYEKKTIFISNFSRCKLNAKHMNKSNLILVINITTSKNISLKSIFDTIYYQSIAISFYLMVIWSYRPIFATSWKVFMSCSIRNLYFFLFCRHP